MINSRSTVVHYVVRAARTIRDVWLVLGATLALIVLLESGYRFLRMAKHVADRFSPARASEPVSPFETTAWAADYWIGHQKEEAVRWTPYVYLRNPAFQAPHASVDSDGHRITPPPEPVPRSGRTVRVFFLGGSTTFGWYQRAALTIPAEAGRRLQAVVGDSARVEVTNFGVPGHTFTQEILELLLQLRAGARPDVVVFYDGINDVMATVQNGRAGLPQNESNREKDFVRGRLLAAEPGFANDLSAVGHVADVVLSRLQFAQALLAARRPKATPPLPADSLAKSIVDMYAANTRIVEALAAHYGFEPVYVWQPALLSTRKPLTARERWLRRPEADPYVHTIRDVHMGVPMLITPAMRQIVGPRFVDATDLFRDDPSEVFVDLFGHTYERANPPIVEMLMPNLAAAVSRALSHALSGGPPL